MELEIKEPKTILIRKSRFLKLILIAGIAIGLDQLAKYFILTKIPLHGCINVVPNFLNITHIYNQGGAFGFMSNTSVVVKGIIFFGVAPIIILLILGYYKTISDNHKYLKLGLSLIVGGAISNTIDRLYLGGVLDFIDCHVHSYHWPTFNLADSFIIIGIVIFVACNMSCKLLHN